MVVSFVHYGGNLNWYRVCGLNLLMNIPEIYIYIYIYIYTCTLPPSSQLQCFGTVYLFLFFSDQKKKLLCLRVLGISEALASLGWYFGVFVMIMLAMGCTYSGFVISRVMIHVEKMKLHGKPRKYATLGFAVSSVFLNMGQGQGRG